MTCALIARKQSPKSLSRIKILPIKAIVLTTACVVPVNTIQITLYFLLNELSCS